MKVFVGVGGASGSIYARSLIRALDSAGVELHLSFSRAALINASLEFSTEILSPQDYIRHIGIEAPHYDCDDIAAKPASGSFLIDNYVIIPASAGFVGRLAAGVSSDLLQRASDVALKEGRNLTIAFRETPLSLIHLRNLTTIKEAGANVVPLMPGFYTNPINLEDIASFMTMKLMDIMGVHHESDGTIASPKRWGGVG